jgi:hypothetical protein
MENEMNIDSWLNWVKRTTLTELVLRLNVSRTSNSAFGYVVEDVVLIAEDTKHGICVLFTMTKEAPESIRLRTYDDFFYLREAVRLMSLHHAFLPEWVTMRRNVCSTTETDGEDKTRICYLSLSNPVVLGYLLRLHGIVKGMQKRPDGTTEALVLEVLDARLGGVIEHSCRELTAPYRVSTTVPQ